MRLGQPLANPIGTFAGRIGAPGFSSLATLFGALQLDSLSAANQFVCRNLVVTGKILVFVRGVESLEQVAKAGFAVSKVASDLSDGNAGAPDGGRGAGAIDVGELQLF